MILVAAGATTRDCFQLTMYQSVGVAIQDVEPGVGTELALS